jgi:2-methylcitrate dehydratase PrpD
VRSRIRIKLKDGRVIEGRYDFTRGHPEKPMNWTELGEKFYDCASLVLPRKNAENAMEFVARLEQQPSLSPLLRALAKGTARGKRR